MQTTYPLPRGNTLECVVCQATVTVTRKGELPAGWSVLCSSGHDFAYCPTHADDPVIKL